MIKNKFLTILIIFGATLAFFVSAGPVYAGVDYLLRGRVFKESVAISCPRPDATQYNDLYFLGTTCAPGTPGTSPYCNGGPDYTITWSQPSNGWSGSLSPNECDNNMGPNTYAPSYFSGTAGQQQEGNPTGVSTNIIVTSDSKYKITDWGFALTDESGYFCHKDGDITKPLQVDAGAFAIPNQTQSITLPFYIYDETDGSEVIHNCYKNHVTFASKTDPRGNLDSATCSVATGWTCDPDNFSQPINVEFYTINGGNPVSLGSTTANIDTGRQDVANQCGGGNNWVHGFSFNIPNTLKDGANHEIHAKGIDINKPPDGDKELVGSPRSITCSPSPGPPAITSLQIGNADPNQTVPSPGATPFVGTSKTAGLTRAESGSNWLNPMAITLNATGSDGQPNSTIKEYYVAFYDKTGGLAPENSTASFLNNIQTRLNTNPKNGFLLKYDTKGTSQTGDDESAAWDGKNNRWIVLTDSLNGHYIYNNLNQLILTMFPRGFHSWKVQIQAAFDNKNMYTGASVVDNNTLTNTRAEIP